MKKDEAEYLGKLERLGCVVCRLYAEAIGEPYEPPPSGSQMTVIHHPRDGVGGAQKASNWVAVPLCVADHTGPTGVHGSRARTHALKIFNTELDLVAETIRIFHKFYRTY